MTFRTMVDTSLSRLVRESVETQALMKDMLRLQLKARSTHETVVNPYSPHQLHDHTLDMSRVPCLSPQSPRKSRHLKSLDTVEIPVRTIPTVPGACHPGCTCHCHERYSATVPFKHIGGHLSIHTSGIKRVLWKCQAGCKQNGINFNLQVTYLLPARVACRMVNLEFLRNKFNEPSFSVKIRNVLPDYHEWFSAAKCGDIDTLRALLAECPARVNDVDDLGFTAAFVSFSRFFISLTCWTIGSEYFAIFYHRVSSVCLLIKHSSAGGGRTSPP